MEMSEESYIEERLDNQIEWYNSKSQWNQKCYKWLKNFELILSALIPVLLVASFDEYWTKIVVGFFGATITVISGLHGLYNFFENWIEYRATAETLKHEKNMYLTHSGVYSDCDGNFQQLVERTESIISKENVNWAGMKKASCKETKTT